jgi:hypothetical protein
VCLCSALAQRSRHAGGGVWCAPGAEFVGRAREQGTTARRTRVAVAALAATMLLCVAAVASIQRGSGRAVLLPDEVDGLELNAYLTPQDVEEFKKVSTGLEPGRLRV